MKKIFLGIALNLSFFSIAQEMTTSDALRYAVENINGTARFRGMSGAFGAVGGDFSAISVNPAGSAIFSNNQVGVSFSNQNIKNNSNYFGTGISESKNSFILNQAGAVFVFHDHNPSNNWKKITIGATYENTNNFDNRIVSVGTNPTNSIDKYLMPIYDNLKDNIEDKEEASSEFIQLCGGGVNHMILFVVNKPSD